MKSFISFLIFLYLLRKFSLGFKLIDNNQLQYKDGNSYDELSLKKKEDVNGKEYVDDSSSKTTKKPKCIYCKKLRDFEGWD